MAPFTIFHERRSRRVIYSLIFFLWFFARSASQAFAAGEPSYLPPQFACEVRYHFRESLPAARKDSKKVSAPSYEREGLSLSRAVISQDFAAQVVAGKVPHLPYQFVVKITRTTDADAGILEVNVLDSSDKPLKDFPTKLANPLTKTGDSSRKEFEIPVPEWLAKEIA